VDEPFAVEGLRHILQNCNAPKVVSDQIVVGRKYPRYLLLSGKVGERNFNRLDIPQANRRLRGTSDETLNLSRYRFRVEATIEITAFSFDGVICD